MIKDCYLWRYAIRLTIESYLEDLTPLDLLIYVYGMDYIKKMEKKHLVDMVYQLSLEAGKNIVYQSADTIVEDWYKTALK